MWSTLIGEGPRLTEPKTPVENAGYRTMCAARIQNKHRKIRLVPETKRRNLQGFVRRVCLSCAISLTERSTVGSFPEFSNESRGTSLGNESALGKTAKTVRAAYLNMWMRRARVSRRFAVENRSPRPQVSVIRCRRYECVKPYEVFPKKHNSESCISIAVSFRSAE